MIELVALFGVAGYLVLLAGAIGAGACVIVGIWECFRALLNWMDSRTE